MLFCGFQIFSNIYLQKRPVSAKFFFLFFFLFCTTIYGQQVLDNKYDFVVTNQTLPDGLWSLTETTDVQIVFSNNDFSEKEYSFSFQQKSLRFILDRLLENEGLRFTYEDDQVLILKKTTPKVTVSGYVEDVETGERLIGANIYEVKSQLGTTTNEYGFFSLTTKVVKPVLEVSYLGYATYRLPVGGSNKEQVLVLLKPSLTLTEIVVVGRDSISNNNFTESATELNLSEKLISLPTLGGEVDVLRIMQQLPGVQNGTDGLGGLYVRGGNADQNLVLLDGVPVYNPYHALGLYSIFDHNIIKKVKYLRGEFPARYGGRISSVVDVRTKEGNNKEYHGQGTVGLIASKLALEGPTQKNKGAFFISARRTHLDPFLKRYSEQERRDNGDTGSYNYYFGEVIAKLNHQLSAKDRIYLSFYKGNDTYQNDKETDRLSDDFRDQSTLSQDLTWGNTLGVLRWNHQFGNKLFTNLTATYSQFKFTSNELRNEQYTLDGTVLFADFIQSIYRSRINTFSVKYDVEYVPSPNHYIRAGIVGSQHLFSPGAVSQRDSSSIEEEVLSEDVSGLEREVLEAGLYFEDDWQIGKKLKINWGAYVSLFAVPDKNYLLVDPRLALQWKITRHLQFSASANRMTQQLHLLTRTDSGFPSDLWVPSTSKIKPQRSWMFDAGLNWRFKKDWSVTTSAYYKRMSNLLNYTEGSNALPNTGVLISLDWENRVTTGTGLSKGIELLLKKENAKNVGWLSYTLSESTRQFDEINSGERFPFRYDLRHVLNLSYSRQLTERWRVAGSFAIYSGSRISLALNEWQYVRQDGKPDFVYQNFGEKNSYTLPAYHRLDISASYKKEIPKGYWSVDMGIYNVYNRRNIYYIESDYNPGTQTLGYTSVSLIPVLPYVSLSISI
ncbi:MAG: carboxypeptidase-like regulatory domain-containing protein [Saprospiraceae bacterium]